MPQDPQSPVLLDVPDGDAAFERSVLERLGHRVMQCGGPATDALCPLLTGKGCTLFDAAHGVVFELDLDRPQHRDIVSRYRDLAPEDAPVWIVVRPGQRERYASLLDRFQVWDHLPTAADLDGFAAAVEAADRYT